MAPQTGTVLALAEQLAVDEQLRTRLVSDPRGVLAEWELDPDRAPATVVLPDLGGLGVRAEAPEDEPDPMNHAPEPIDEPAPMNHAPDPLGDDDGDGD
jgi:hypothetical protein